MSLELKALIEKIQEEGVQAAEDRAKEIESQARTQAEKIVQAAKKEASKILSEAQERIAKDEKSQITSLKQSGRNLLLALRKEILKARQVRLNLFLIQWLLYQKS